MTPSLMKAIAIDGGSGPAEALRLVEIPVPVPQPGEVLIRVRAAGVNRPDVFQRMGLYPPPPGAPTTLGLEVSGEVAAVGPAVDRWKIGDHVTALLGGGGYAGYAIADQGLTLPVPQGLTFIQACSLPETAFTVYANVVEHGMLKPGETIMIHGATSGIGVMAIQMANSIGARVIATGRGPEKASKASALGADIAVDATAQDFVEVAETEGGVDVILDMVGGSYFERNLKALRPMGRLVQIAFQAGAKVELSLPDLMQKRLVITGSTLRARTTEEKARLAAQVEAHVWPMVEMGRIDCIIDQTFPLEQAAQAHSWLEAGDHVGKVILTI